MVLSGSASDLFGALLTNITLVISVATKNYLIRFLSRFQIDGGVPMVLHRNKRLLCLLGLNRFLRNF
jgi:hypothetical protein